MTKESFGKAFNRIFNQLTITVLLILIQLGYYALVLLRLSEYASWINMVFIVAAFIMCLFIAWRDDNPAYKIAWIMVVCLFPILGTTMYVFFGNKRPSRPLKRKIEPMEKLHRDDLTQQDELKEITSGRLLDTVNYVSTHGPYPAWNDTKNRYYPLADYAYPELLEDLGKAEHFIFMEYFIISDGGMWQSIFDILKQKAAAGVDVRLIYDDFGSLPTIPKGFVKELRDAGIKVLTFNPIKPIVSLVYNNRDHRKITVIDGYIGYTGGFNLADEYINEEERFGHWKDSGLRLEGEAVWNFTVMFLNMWNAFIKTEESYDAFKPRVHHPEPFHGDGGIVQPYSDSPLDDENVGENVYLEIINQAESYVYIFTPYLVIDSEMQTALTMAAKRGVDVRIVTPGIPDKKMVFRLTRSYYKPLIKAGVKIYEYKPGFIHAKSFLSDDRVGVVGTINMDYRSLFLHFECATLLIGCESLQTLKKDCMETFEMSKKITKADYKNSFFGMLVDGLLRMLSPLL